jgi:putative ABC transport system permease protein
VSEFVRLHRFIGQLVLDINGVNFNERNWFCADPNFFNVFDFVFISGDKLTALQDPHSVVLTKSTAERYFRDDDPIGKIIEIKNFGTVKVSGVIKDVPVNSHLQFDMIFSDILNNEGWKKYLNSWRNFGAYTYVVLNERKSITRIESAMPEFTKKFQGPDSEFLETRFQPIQDIHLYSDAIEEGAEQIHGRLSYVYIFSSMAIFLLVIAAINYINLTTSKANSRAKEIGVRKVAGAYKLQLVAQFLTETLVITFISLIISIGMMDMAFPYFNTITGKDFDINLNTLNEHLPFSLLITVIIAVLAGSYPAFYLARLKPISSLRAQPLYTKRSQDFRTALVVVQFSLSIVLIVSTMVIGNQLSFIQTKDIGFDKEQLMIIDINSGNVRKQFQTIKNELASIPGVESVAVSSRVPGEWKNIREVFVRSTDGSSGAPDSLQSYFMGFDEDMLSAYKLDLEAGNYFSGNTQVDSGNVVLNEAIVKILNLKNPIGSVLTISTGERPWAVKVMGVVRDFNFQSLHQKIAPMIIGYQSNPLQAIDYFTLKISNSEQAVIKSVTAVYSKFDPESPIEYHFLDQQLNSFYVEEKKAGMIFQLGGALSIVVACLGLLGLANYQIERRTKELGIRKVLGASGANLFMLVSSAFLRQVAIAFVVACPVAYYVMNQWLNAFQYRITLSAGIFLLAGGLVLLLALATVSFRSITAAGVSPVDSLKNE